MQTTLLDVVLRTAAIYAVLFIALRLLGKREVSQFTPFDLVLLLILANAVQNAMVGDNSTLLGGVAAAFTLLAINFILGKLLAKNVRLRHWVEGTPTLLVRHGKVEWRAMQHENLDQEALSAAMRAHGLKSVSQIELAVLELDGSISIIGSNGPRARRGKKHA